MFIVALQTCASHIEQSVRLIRLLRDIAQINPWSPDTELWVVHNQDVRTEHVETIRAVCETWKTPRIVPSIDNRSGWPTGPNYCWKTIFLEAQKTVWNRDHVGIFCIEPDCIPLSVDWLHSIQKAWDNRRSKHILGHLESANGRHINGNAVYDARLFTLYPSASVIKTSGEYREGVAYDFANAELFLQIGEDSNLIIQDYHRGRVTKEYFDSIQKNGERPVWFHGSKTSDGLEIARKAILKDAQLFIRTWQNDLDWLQTCLKSVSLFWRSSLGTTIVATPQCQDRLSEPKFQDLLESVKANVHYEPQNNDSRRGSVYIGMTMDKYVTEELVCNIDSDCIFTRPSTAMDFTHRGSPIIWMDTFSHLHQIRDGDAYAWDGYKQVIQECLGYDSEYEYMQRHPFIYYLSSIQETRDEIEKRTGVPLLQVMERYPANIFSEFNLFGAFEHMRRQRDRYYFMFKHELEGEERVLQFHSWSQTPASKRLEIERYFKLEEA